MWFSCVLWCVGSVQAVQFAECPILPIVRQETSPALFCIERISATDAETAVQLSIRFNGELIGTRGRMGGDALIAELLKQFRGKPLLVLCRIESIPESGFSQAVMLGYYLSILKEHDAPVNILFFKSEVSHLFESISVAARRYSCHPMQFLRAARGMLPITHPVEVPCGR